MTCTCNSSGVPCQECRERIILKMESKIIEEMKSFPQLKNFSLPEQQKLRRCEKRVWLIASFFDSAISRVAFDVAIEARNFAELCDGDGDGNYKDPRLGEGGSNQESRTLGEQLLSRSAKYLRKLKEVKGIFLENPGEYGICLECGEPIPLARLEEVPACRHCVKCKNLSHQYA